MATLRLRLKNLRTLYSLRLPYDPTYAEVATLVTGPYDTVQRELSALIDGAVATEGGGEQGEDVPVEAVRQLALKLNGWGYQSTQVAIPDDGKRPLAAHFVRLATLLQREIYLGAAEALDLLTDMYDPEHASERDMEEEIREMDEYLARAEERADEEGEVSEGEAGDD